MATNKPRQAEALTAQLDFSGDKTRGGFRLQQLELFNWGTFNDRVWTLQLHGDNCLLTGDIGSGKSTLVDALTTLLVPANKVDYNKAAGAERKERDLRSYVQGYYKSERNQGSSKSRPVALRDQNSYSVILGVFHNQGFDQTVTLAQVFWVKELQGQPERFYICAEQALNIKQHFAQFGSEIKSLRKRLRKDGCEILDHFPAYGAWFRRRFGIHNEQALDLFHQTVSMKSVGNLTEFVRNHMLEPFDVKPRIQALIEHFDDLNRAHEAVLKARRQIDSLTPLVADCDQYRQLTDTRSDLQQCREALATYFAAAKLRLLEERLADLQTTRERLRHKLQVLDNEAGEQRNQQLELKQQIAANGGDRIERLQQEIQQQQTERERRYDRAERYRSLLEALALPAAKDADAFAEQQDSLQQRRENLNEEQAACENRRKDIEFDFRRRKETYEELRQTISGLKSRKSNIDQRQINIRRQMCEALSLDETDLPFAGELLQVREEDRPWEGAIERLMHNFGLSLLVPDEHYARIAQWVDETQLGGRLVYYRVRGLAQRSLPSLHPDSLVHKVAIKPDSGFYAWLEQELARRFDVACCADQAQFRRETRAITRRGQIKGADERHEKDDRFRLDDRSRYVLGWTNEGKIAALEQEARLLEREMANLGPKIGALRQEEKGLAAIVDAIGKLEEYHDFEELNWQPLARHIAGLQDALQQLQSASDILQTLTQQLLELEARQKSHAEKSHKAHEELGRNEQRIETSAAQREEAYALANSPEAEQSRPCYADLEALMQEALGDHSLTIETCDRQQQDLRKWLQSRMDTLAERLSRLQTRIVKAMSGYNNEYPLDTRDVDTSVESAEEYRQMLATLLADDLPRFEARFKELLNENAIREIASFQSQLQREREAINENVSRINESLTRIDYNPGRYIKLEAQPTQDISVREFQVELRACTEGALTGSEDEQYSETKFLQVKRIIERFRGREGLTDTDRRWTSSVTDVRNWFTFAASERYREDNKEHEHYSDSGGKSGGQKEKLAYTILAASLAYQFGLEWGASRSRTFRFVVIDEAFGRGSDESTQYGLRLFAELDLQLLIVTPLQKIHIIEPYVASVGFVHNEDGRASKLRNLSIEAYQLEKARLHERLN